MPRMKILNSIEWDSFDRPAKLNSFERKKFLTFPKDIVEFVSKMRSSSNALGFLLSFGYYRFSGKFYSPQSFQNSDIDFIQKDFFPAKPSVSLHP